MKQSEVTKLKALLKDHYDTVFNNKALGRLVNSCRVYGEYSFNNHRPEYTVSFYVPETPTHLIKNILYLTVMLDGDDVAYKFRTSKQFKADEEQKRLEQEKAQAESAAKIRKRLAEEKEKLREYATTLESDIEWVEHEVPKKLAPLKEKSLKTRHYGQPNEGTFTKAGIKRFEKSRK